MPRSAVWNDGAGLLTNGRLAGPDIPRDAAPDAPFWDVQHKDRCA